MVIIPKCKGEYRGIGIIEVSWKVCAVVVNFRFKWGVVFHDALQGFIGEGGGKDSHAVIQPGPTASDNFTQASLSSVLRSPQVIQITGHRAMS